MADDSNTDSDKRGFSSIFDRGREFAEERAEEKAREAIVEVFEDYSADDLRNYILVQYPLVQKEIPTKYERKLRRGGDRYEDLIRKKVKPENVRSWLEEPDWAPTEEARLELQRCIDTIDDTPGGREWFHEQVYAIWAMAGIEPPKDTGED